jgi:hypothetical protein
VPGVVCWNNCSVAPQAVGVTFAVATSAKNVPPPPGPYRASLLAFAYTIYVPVSDPGVSFTNAATSTFGAPTGMATVEIADEDVAVVFRNPGLLNVPDPFRTHSVPEFIASVR